MASRARALLGYGGGLLRAWHSTAYQQQRAPVIDPLEGALEQLDEVDSDLRARLLGHLAEELYFASSERRVSLSADAVAMARRLAATSSPATASSGARLRCTSACWRRRSATWRTSSGHGRSAPCWARSPGAEEHFEVALAVNEEMGAKPWVGHTCQRYAATLLRRAGPADLERARRLAERALLIGEECGMARLVARATALRDASRRPRPVRPAAL